MDPRCEARARLAASRTVPEVVKYLFWSRIAAAAASIDCRSVHVVAECMEADGRTAARRTHILFHADIDRRRSGQTPHCAVQQLRTRPLHFAHELLIMLGSLVL